MQVLVVISVATFIVLNERIGTCMLLLLWLNTYEIPLINTGHGSTQGAGSSMRMPSSHR